MPTAPATASRVCGSSAARTASYTLRRGGSAGRGSAAVAGSLDIRRLLLYHQYRLSIVSGSSRSVNQEAVMRRLTFRPALTTSGRKFKGLRGFAGKPFHPPLTDVPVVAYLFTAAFDILSVATHSGHPVVARQLYIAGTWTLIGGAVVSLLAALTGWADWHRSSEPGTQARRTINAHAVTMLTVTALVLVDLGVRALGQPDRASTSTG